MTDARTLGASQLAAALGLSPFATPLETYLRIRGESPPQPDSIRMKMGRALENDVLSLAEDALGAPITRRQERVTHADFPFLHATIDGECRVNGALEGIEAKTTRSRDGWGAADTDQLPQHYLVQAQAQALLAGWQRVRVPVLFVGLAEFDIYTVAADPELQRMLAEGARDFMLRVERADPPAPTTYSDIAKRWPRHTDSQIIATPEIAAEVADLARLKREAKDIEALIEGREADVKKFMAEHGELVSADGLPLATWRASKDGKALDGERLKAERPDIYAEFQITRPGSRRFLIKSKGE